MRDATFTIQAKIIPVAWNEFHKELGCRHGDRQTEDFPIWWRIDGPGYTFWVSTLRLSNSASTPPTWTLKLESLATLPQAGIEKWDMTYAAIIQFLEEADVKYIVT